MAGRSVADERCGYTYDVSTLHDVGACSCWRPTWEDQDRCIWHVSNISKSADLFEDLIPRPGERLDGVVVNKMSLDGIDWFEECSLIGAEFTSVDLRDASLVKADMREASIDNVDARRADLSHVNLEDTAASFCDLRDATLVNSRFDQAVFSNVRINRGTKFGETLIYEQHLDESTDEETSYACAQAAIWSYREIHDLHESNALAFEGRHYFLKEKDIRRRLTWQSNHYRRALKSEAARWITGYGMSPWRVLGTGAVVILVSAVLYPTTGGLEETISRQAVNGGTTSGNQTTITWSLENPSDTSRYFLALVFFRSLYFSVVTFTTLGYGDISPVGDLARAIAGIEAVLGQLILALLVFVLSQRLS